LLCSWSCVAVAATVAERLLQARQAKGLSLRKLASLISVEPSTLSHIERGHSEPSLRVLRSLARVLEVSPSWLGCLELEGDVEAAPDQEDAEPNR